MRERERERKSERDRERGAEGPRQRKRALSLEKKPTKKAEPIITCQYILIRFFVTSRGTQSLCRPARM